MGFKAAKGGQPLKNGGSIVSYSKVTQVGDHGYITKNILEAFPAFGNKHSHRFLGIESSILRDIVAYWKFADSNHSSTHEHDEVHNYVLATDTAASGYTTTTGKFGSTALYTSPYGSNLKLTQNQYIDNFGLIIDTLESQSISFSQEFTITLWHNPAFVPGHQANLVKKGLGGNDREFSLDLNTLNTGTGNIIFRASSGGSTFDVNLSGNVISDSSYHFYAARINTAKGIVSLNIDNVKYKTSFTPSTFLRSSGQIMVGSGAYLKLDGLGFWNRYLSDDEIAHIYNNRDGRNYPFGCSDPNNTIYKNTAEKLITHVAPKLANQYQYGALPVSAVVLNAHLYDLLVYNTDIATYRLDLASNNGLVYQKNPNTVSLIYFSSMDIPTGVAGGLTPGRPITYNFATGVRPEWYLQNASGERVNLYIYDSTAPTGYYWAFNASNPEAGRYFANHIKDNINSLVGIDGTYYDWMQTKLSPTFNVSSPAWRKAPIDIDLDGVAESNANLDAIWVSGYKAMLQYGVEQWPTNKIHIGNAGWWTGPEYYSYVNGIMIEEFRTARNTVSYNWHEQMQSYTGYLRFARQPRLSIIHTTNSISSGYAFARFTFCSAMLSDGYYINTNPNDDGPYGRNYWHDEYAVNRFGTAEKSLSAKGYFGKPLGEAYNIDTPSEKFYNALDTTTNTHTKKWAREYEKVIVLCNPLGISGTFNLGRAYRKIQGIYDTVFNNGLNNITSITLPPSGGCVLLKPEYFL